ncbi:MAG: pyridoxal 5'-phosphate synthase glutaminase subunit PdxT [Nitrososphaerota archaeon]
MEISVGVASFQGDVEEHLAAVKEALKRIGVRGTVSTTRLPEEVESVDAVIIPGGESTVMGKLSSYKKSLDILKRRIGEGLPTLGTCAGLIMLAKRVYDRVVGETGQPVLGVLDILVERNTYGRQRDSFEAQIEIPVLGLKSFRAVFIRAPAILETGPRVEVLASFANRPIAVKQDNILGTTFHPELSGSTVFHEELIRLATVYKSR